MSKESVGSKEGEEEGQVEEEVGKARVEAVGGEIGRGGVVTEGIPRSEDEGGGKEGPW